MITHQSTLLTEALWLRNWQAGTYVSSTSFTVTGNQTAQFQPGCSVQLIVGSGAPVYSYVLTSTYGTNTTIVLTDSLLTNNPIACRVATSDPVNNSLGRFFREVQVTGPNGLTVTNNSTAQVTLVVPSAGPSTVGWWQISANSSGQLSFLAALNATSTKTPVLQVSTSGATPGVQFLSPITVTTPIGSSNVVTTYNQTTGSVAYQFYLDNVGENNAASRFWLAAPITGEVAIGPRDGTAPMNLIRLRATSVQVENSAGGYGSGGEVWHSKNLNPAIYAQQGLSNTWVSGTSLPISSSLNSVTSSWTQYTPSTTNNPSAGYGIAHTISVVGDQWNSSSSSQLYQQAYDASGQQIYVRYNINNGGWSSWAQIYTAANFNPGNYVPLSGGVTVTNNVNITPSFTIQQSAGSPTLYFKSLSGLTNSYDASFVVNGGTSGTSGKGSIAVNASSITLPPTTVNGGFSVSQNATILGTTFLMPSVGLGLGASNGQPAINFNLNAGSITRAQITLDPNANLIVGMYNSSQGYLGNAAIFNQSSLGMTVPTMTVTNTLTVSNAASLNSTLTVGSLGTFNGNVPYSVGGQGASSSISCAWDVHSINGGFVGQHTHSFGTYSNFGQGLEQSWNDYGDGGGVFTCHRGGGSGAFRFRITGDGVGFSNVFYINSSGQAFAASDKKFKKEVTNLDLNSAIKFVDQVRARHFLMTPTGSYQIGLVAQEAEPYAPYIVDYDQFSDQMNVSYDRMPVYHHEVLKYVLDVGRTNNADIQALLHTVEKQQQEINELKKQIDKPSFLGFKK